MKSREFIAKNQKYIAEQILKGRFLVDIYNELVAKKMFDTGFDNFRRLLTNKQYQKIQAAKEKMKRLRDDKNSSSS